MIHDQDLLMFHRAKVCNTAMHVHNMSLHKILGDSNPKEAFIGVKQEIEHLRNFGFPVYIHVHVEKKTKLESSG